MDLFDKTSSNIEKEIAPLADRMRPRSIDEFVGQSHILAPGSLLRRAIEEDKVDSMILWGPPGSGKTSLAHIIARSTRSKFKTLSAVLCGVADIKRLIEEAKNRLKFTGQRTILFIDEIHRFNKAQQDVLLPHVEKGTVTLIGATTENPSFEVNAALLSRMRVYILNPLKPEELEKILDMALTDKKRGLSGLDVRLTPEARRFLISASHGDARALLNALEAAAAFADADDEGKRVIDVKIVADAMQKRALLYDKSGEEHYNLISALHKSLRDSDPDAALYWMVRMLEGGEDPLYIARRLVRFAAEDVGLADPDALKLAVAAMQAYHFVGSPEGELALAEATIYLALTPKSNSIYKAYQKARETVENRGPLPVPMHLKNAPTGFMKRLGYGKGYKYAHDYEDAIVDQQHLPDEIRDTNFYEPTQRGREKEIAKRLEEIKRRIRELRIRAGDKKV